MRAFAAFIEEIREDPSFISAAAADHDHAQWLGTFEDLFSDLETLNDPDAIDLFDEVTRILAEKELPLRDRLLKLREVMVEARPKIEAMAQRLPTPKQ